MCMYIVSVSKDKWGERKKCKWLGHKSFKCALCKLGYVHVTNLDEHDATCDECGAHVVVERAERADGKQL